MAAGVIAVSAPTAKPAMTWDNARPPAVVESAAISVLKAPAKATPSSSAQTGLSLPLIAVSMEKSANGIPQLTTTTVGTNAKNQTRVAHLTASLTSIIRAFPKNVGMTDVAMHAASAHLIKSATKAFALIQVSPTTAAELVMWANVKTMS